MVQRKNIELLGKYSFTESEDNLNFEIKNKFFKNSFVLDSNLEFNQEVNFELINYQNSKDSLSKLSVNLRKNDNDLYFNEIKLIDDNNLILINDLKIEKNLIASFKKVKK